MNLHDNPQLPRPISRIFFRGCAQQVQTELLARLPIHEGTVLSDELLQRTLQVAKACDGRLEILVNPVVPREAFLRLPQEVRNRLTPPASDEAVNVTIYDPASGPQRIKVEANVQEHMLVDKVMPVDPRQIEESARDTDVVQLAVVVGKDGNVMDVKPLGGPEWLVDSAVDAVRRWKYRPTLLNGLPVEVQTTVEVTFAPNLRA